MSKQKHVILFGQTGAGKSTVANMLYQGSLSKENPFKIANACRGVTLDCIKRDSVDGEWVIYDTVGYGEPDSGSVPHKEAEKKVIDFLYRIENAKFDFVCIVRRCEGGRFSAMDKLVKDIVCAIFGNQKKHYKCDNNRSKKELEIRTRNKRYTYARIQHVEYY